MLIKRGRGRPSISNETKQRATDLIKEGYTLSSIAEHLQISLSTVFRIKKDI